MSHNIDKIIYINLDHRTDRKAEIEGELEKFNLLDKTERYPAICVKEQGILGCTMSHLEVFKLAKARHYKNVLILEDDFQFLISKEEFEQQLTDFFTENIEYDVCMISYNLIQSELTAYPFLLKVNEAQTASGYIVNHTMYDRLIQLFEEAIPPLRNTQYHWIYANDQIKKRMQPTSNWYCFKNRFGKQRDGYSDNSQKYENYNC